MFEYLEPRDGPVFDGLEVLEVTWAKEQPQYKPLRTLTSRDREKRVTSRWTLTEEQRKAVAGGADIFLTLMTFGNPLQPITMVVSDDREGRKPGFWTRLWLRMRGRGEDSRPTLNREWIRGHFLGLWGEPAEQQGIAQQGAKVS